MSESGDRPDDPASEPWLAGPPPPPPPPGPPPPGAPTGPATDESGSSRWDLTGLGPAHKRAAASGWRAIQTWSVWDLAAGAILFAFFVTWAASVLESFRHEPGVDSQYRVLVFFSPGSLQWALAIALAVALAATGRRFEVPADTATPRDHNLILGLGAAGGAVAVSAAIDTLVELTNFGHGIDDALVGILSYLAVIPLALATCWWTHKLLAQPTR